MAITNEDIEDAAGAPKRVVTDEGTIEERSIQDLIDADNHVKSRKVTDLPPHGLRISRFKPGGAV